MESKIVGTVDGMGYLYCAACRPARTAVSDGCVPVYSDAAPHNTEACEGCHKPLVLAGAEAEVQRLQARNARISVFGQCSSSEQAELRAAYALRDSLAKCSCPANARGPWECLDCPVHGAEASADVEAEARSEQQAESAWLRAAENQGYNCPDWAL